MPKFTATSLVMLSIKQVSPKLMREFMIREDVWPVLGHGYGDPDVQINFWYPKDSEKVM